MDPHERARLKKLRSLQRREERKKRKLEGGDTTDERRTKKSGDEYTKPMVKDDYLWIRKDLAMAYAGRILNHDRRRPYWLSIPHRMGDGVLPVPNLYPCTTFRTESRAYFGFLFREHRELFFATLDRARKETTDKVRSINPAVV
jgi:hypothetical protein